MRALTPNHSYKVCKNLVMLDFSIMNTKVINGITVRENYYYCFPTYKDKRDRLIVFGIVVIVGLLFIGITFVGSGLLLIVSGLTIMGYAVINYPKTNEIHVVLQSDQTRIQELEEFAEMNRITGTTGVRDYEDDPYLHAPRKVKPDNSKQVFSEILEKYVDPCCYQTVRLED